MPLTFTAQKTPKDRPFVRTVTSGCVTAEDTQPLIAALAPGAALANAPILSVVEPGTEFTAEARKSFGSMGANSGPGQLAMPVAMVVPSAALRVLISFILKMTGSTGTTKFFGNENEAKQWLFSLVDA